MMDFGRCFYEACTYRVVTDEQSVTPFEGDLPYSPELRDLIMCTLDKNPARKPTFADIVSLTA